MNERHIAFVTLPHTPHVNPTLTIVQALLRRGYRVSYVTSERFASQIATVGAEVVKCEKLLLEPPPEAFNQYSRRMLADIVPFYREHRPTLILFDFLAFAGRILAKQERLPAVLMSPFYAFDEGDFSAQVKHPEFRAALIESAISARDFLSTYGVNGTNHRVDKEKLNIYLFPRALQPDSARFGENCFFAGRCAVERVTVWNRSWQRTGRRVALVAMSTLMAASKGPVQIPAYYKMCADVLPRMGWDVLLSVGERCNIDSLMPVPPHCQLIQHTAYMDVLAHADLLIFMSGIVSTAEAAYYGVPMIAVTEGGHEYEWQAEHLVELGIGAHIRKSDLSAESIAEAARQLTESPDTARRLKEMKWAVRRDPGGEETANRIEEHLETLR